MIFKFFTFTIVTIALYFSTAYLLIFFPSQKNGAKVPLSSSSRTLGLTEIFILYDTMHSDIVIKTDALDYPFRTYLETLIQNREGYIAFGWGDRESYLSKSTWGQMRLSSMLKALFINTPSVMHVHFYKSVKKFKNLKKIQLSNREEELVIENIFKSFNLENIENDIYEGYGQDDLFYPSIYSYNLFNTCNTCTGNILRDSNISISYWTPFSYNVIDSLPNESTP